MLKKISRRLGLKMLTAGGLLSLFKTPKAQAQESEIERKRIDRWDNTWDRVWLGGEFWANPMEDWEVKDGWAQCNTDAAGRNIHSLLHPLTEPGKPFSMSVEIKKGSVGEKDGGAGFRIGLKTEIDEYRSNCFAKGGVDAGLAGNNLFIAGKKSKTTAEAGESFQLQLDGKPDGEMVTLTLSAFSADSKVVGSVSHKIKADNITGNVALVSQFKGSKQRSESTGYRFSHWELGGEAFTNHPERTFGPLLWSMYTLSDCGDEGFVMKMIALTGPLGKKDDPVVELQVKRNDQWESLGHSNLDTDAWAATFKFRHWDEKTETPYRLLYKEIGKDNQTRISEWSGTIQANPEGRPLRLAALTCQNDYSFPYAPVTENIVKLKPDMIYFSGDQLYESHGGFGIIRDPAGPAILSYLRKYYQFGWAFRESMKNAPTVCLPDDHDVFQGNIWGEGGAPMKDIGAGASSKGGYREPAKMVNVVHLTNTGHHPDPYDSNPSEQEISVYYGDLVYGNISFAILGDRQWKSGPERVETGSGRADHVKDPDFDTSKLDKPGLVLLGEQQEAFLKEWGENWRGHKMKVLLSQTVFAGAATHHGRVNGYLKADLDSGGWPQTARDNAIDILRPSMALHINGDQHLTTLGQYGVDDQRDSNWSFCTPAISAGYPRWWLPDEVGMPHTNRPEHDQENTGEYLDGLGNKFYVYAVGNPEVGTEKNRYDKAHQKGSGFGFVTIDTEAKTYYLESFRYQIDATDGKPENQFPGWPVTIHQAENRGENRVQ
ncbi:alkaline phosphatase D family protein [Verrucomicrobiales bacterium]|nr:alkaline phosphatase D family protein [Verrucomicrobiales bacterium]